MNIDLQPKQRIAFFSPATEILYGGAAGGGKSLLLRLSAIRWCEQVPGIQVFFFRRTRPELRDNHLRGPLSFLSLLSKQIATGEVKYNKQDNELIFKKFGNSRITLCHCQYEDNVMLYHGAEIHVLIIDELTTFTEYMYNYLRSRVRLAGLEIPGHYGGMLPRIECGSNPGGVGHSFAKRLFKPNLPDFQNQIWQAPKKEGGMLRQYIPAKLSDNPALLKDDPKYEDRLWGLGTPTLVKAIKDGDWDIFAGQYFENWNPELHILPKDFEIQPWWQMFGGYDHGYTHPYCWGGYAVDGDGNVIKFAEAGNRGREPDQIEFEIRQAWRDGMGFRGVDDKAQVSALNTKLNDLNIWAGHDIWIKDHIHKKYGGRQIVEQFQDFGLTMLQANIDRKAGWSWMRTLMDWRQSPDGEIIKRPKFYVRENCWRTIHCIPSLQIDEKDPEDVMKVDATDGDVWAGDDPGDETRYGLMSLWDPKSVKKKEDAKWGTGGWFEEQLRRQGYDIDLE